MFSLVPRPPSSTLFPYTTLFRSVFTSTESRHVREVVISTQEGGASLDILSGFVAGNFSGYKTRQDVEGGDRKSTRLNSSHRCISYAVFCLKKKTVNRDHEHAARR